MPKKSIREMNTWELLHYSLQTKVFRSILVSMVVLGLVTLVIGLGLYSWSLVNQYIRESFGLVRGVAINSEKWIDEESLVKGVMAIYRGMSEEERSATGTEEYRSQFSFVRDNSNFKPLQRMLREYKESSDVSFLYLGLLDPQTQALVYICDPDETAEDGCYPGDWEYLKNAGMNRFLSWDGSGRLYFIDKTEKYGWMCTSAYPLKNLAGETSCFVMADITLENVWHGMQRFLWQYAAAMAVIACLMGVLMTRHIKKMIVLPINNIAEAAQQYVHDRQSGADSADHFSRLQIRTGDEIENLSLVMADMERDLTDYEHSLTHIAAERERNRTELALATRIQADMLPNQFPPFPERRDLDIYASMDPAKEVGGDFYDFFLIDQDHLGLVIADVSGKGVPAALFMMISKLFVQNYAMTGMTPAQVLEEVNRQICSNNRERMFVTVWLGILDLKTGHLIAANAGHEYPFLKTPEGPFELFKDKHGFVIGGMEDIHYRDYELTLRPGAKLFVFTDGVTEATDRQEQLFGMKRLEDALNTDPAADAETILKNVRGAVDRFVDGAAQFDDMTMLCVEYIGPKGKETEDEGDHSESQKG